eukprot:TRINITY_DN3569_c0_g2_i1.p3 TRINITY_DN3569_c0_g2~~TRINITY_DN3569_c0_g2_i1.p3  ORF type:complete len:149 (-),score=29.80 TRINITY_DN3569_c0_g2_i1:449-895(-)
MSMILHSFKTSKYKLMESQLQRQKESMKQKIPEIKRALDIIEFLEKKQDEEMNLDFLLADTIWAKGKINKGTQKVNLWLGANVLVEYSFDEAKTLLRKNLDNASINLKTFVSFDSLLVPVLYVDFSTLANVLLLETVLTILPFFRLTI